ncbi:MAG: hypothetical protein ACE145_01200 [Terriglobia bacterium]
MGRIWRIVAFALVATIDPLLAQLPPVVPTVDRHYPGPLETLLKNAKSPRIETKVFGTLDGAEKTRVTFKAIIAWHSATPQNKLRGLTIELARGACHHTAYVDVDISTPEFDWLKESVSSLQYIEDKRATERDWRARGSSVGGMFGSILNGLPPSLWDQALAETVLNVGWWKPEDSDFVLSFHSGPCRMLLFPKANMTDVVKAMSAAHDYLWSH